MIVDLLTQMAWKSALIASAALLLLRLLRSRSAADRAAVLQVAVASLLLLPIVACFIPSLQVASPLHVAPADSTAALAASTGQTEAVVATSMPISVSTSGAHVDQGMMLALIYLAGVLLLGARMAAGVAALSLWTARAAPLTLPEWRTVHASVKAALGSRRKIRLRVSDRVGSPLSWGLFRPVILIDHGSLARLQDVEAILAHEIAHVARRDWLALMLARLAVVMFWFNPLVWRVERALVQAAEEAADRRAIERVEPAAYASTLVACVRHAAKPGLALPANAMAPRQALKARVDAILDPEQRRRRSGSLATASAMGLCVLVAGPVAALDVVQAAPPAIGLSRPSLEPTARARASADALPGGLRASEPAQIRRRGDAKLPGGATLVEVAQAGGKPQAVVSDVRLPDIRLAELRIPAVIVPEHGITAPSTGAGLTGAGAAATLVATTSQVPDASKQLNAKEVRAKFMGRDHYVTNTDESKGWNADQSKAWMYLPNGRYRATIGRRNVSGSYTLRDDGRLCWKEANGASGCFVYIERGGQIVQRRVDPGHDVDPGAAAPGKGA